MTWYVVCVSNERWLAGGSCNNGSFGINPQYRVNVAKETSLLLKLELPRGKRKIFFVLQSTELHFPLAYSGNVTMVRSSERIDAVYSRDLALSTGNYRWVVQVVLPLSRDSKQVWILLR